jgi:hypothetical protein
MVDEKVRREKALAFSGCNSRPGTGSLHRPVGEAATRVCGLRVAPERWSIRR